MKKLINLVAGPLAAVLLCVASGSSSYAVTPTTAFVSGGGSDANACTLTQPCRTIGRAVIAAGSGGAVSCLDAGPYTEAFISGDSYTVDCRGVVYNFGNGNIFSFVTDASASVVTFRNVIFDGSAGGGGAVQINGGKVVFENCTFQNFTASPGQAVLFEPSVAGAHLTITDSVFASNGTASAGGGIIIQPSSGVTAGAVIERTQFAGNTRGIVGNGNFGGTALVEVRSSSIANSVFDGILATTLSSVVSIVVNHSASNQNAGSGIAATGAGAYVSLNDSTVDWNATGLSETNGGLILSYKNNLIAGNPSPGVTPLSVSQQ